jgi:hypothetical protein
VGFFILNQYLLIKQIMLEPTEIKLFNKILSRLWNKYDGDVDLYDLAEELESLLGADSFTFQERVFGIWNFITNEIGEDPFEYSRDGDSFLRNNFNENDTINLLDGSGWLDKYYTLDTFIIHPSKENKRKEPRSVYGDIQMEGDKIYLICDYWSDFSVLFNKDDRDVAERVLGEDWSELYGWFDVDFDSDVWDSLDEKSLQHIKEYIKENDFIGKPLDYDEDPDESGLREDMLEDNNLLGELIDNESMFDDLKRELENFYRWAYESAAEDELFGDMKNEIVSLIGSEGVWDMVKSKKEGGSDKHILKFDVTDKFMEYNLNYLECQGEFPQYQEHYFLNVIDEYLDCMGEMLQTPDMGYFYPDSTKIEEHLNYNVLGNL